MVVLRPSLFSLCAFGGLVFVIAGCSREKTAPPDSVTIAVPFELPNLDPHAKDKLGSASILSNVYEGLVTTDAEMRIRPCLAESWESPDPLTWVFRLRSSVSFHNGKPLGAEDVVYSYERLLRSMDLEVRSYLLNVISVKAVGPLAVEIRTRDPSPILLNKLRHVPIIPNNAATPVTDGTGPYKIDSWKTGHSLRLRRNERYWGPRPQLSTVLFALHCSPDDAVRGLQSGRYQFIRADSKTAAATGSRSSEFRLIRQDNRFIKYMGFNLNDPHFSNPVVRRAIHLAIDRERLVSNLSNFAQPASQLVPRFVFGFNPRIPLARRDVDSARTLLKQAGVEHGFESPLYTRQIIAEAAYQLRTELEPLGIHLTVKVLPDAEFFALLESRKAELWLNSVGCVTGDASDFFDAAVHSLDPGHHYGRQNFGQFSDIDMDRAIEKSSSIEQIEARRNALQGIMAATMEKLLFIPLYNDQDVYVIRRGFNWMPRTDSYILASDISAK